MKKLLLLLIVPFLSFGQGWEQIYNDSYVNTPGKLLQANDGGYIFTGTIVDCSQMGEYQLYLFKTDENGQEEWMQTFGGNEPAMGRDIQKSISYCN